MRFQVILVALLASCGSPPDRDSAETKDIFTADADGKRRRKASAEEMTWTINMNGCTGHLISPDLMMTANHCSPSVGASYKSGAALAAGGQSDIQVVDVVERDAGMDFAVLAITWSSGSAPTNQKYPPLIATSASDVVASAESGRGDEIFTVGFPGDKSGTWGATYSEGQLKRISSPTVAYNMGIINGNSGGGVWRKKDFMLVSLTNNGPRMLGMPGWDSQDVDDSSAWNFGVGMWEAYAASSTLRDVFPNGKNRFVKAGDAAGSDALFLAVEPGDGDSVTLQVAAPDTATEVALCASSAACLSGDANAIAMKLQRREAGRSFFRTTLPVTAATNKTFSVTALGAGGTSLGARKVQLQAK